MNSPAGWSLCQISDFAEVKGGKRLPKGHEFSHDTTSFPYLRVSDFENGTISLESVRYLAKETQEQISAYTISKEDLYISIAGTIGVVGCIPESLDGANLTENAAKICEIRYFDKNYLQYYLHTKAAQDSFQEKTVSTTQPKLALFKIRELEIPLPPLAEQKQIAAKLDELLAQVDTIKTRLDAIPHILKRFRQSVLAAATSGELTRAWRDSISCINIQSLVDRIAKSRAARWEAECERVGRRRKYTIPDSSSLEDLPDIPTNWVWLSVDTISFKISDGVHKKPNYQPAGIPFVTVKNLTAGPGISFENLNYISEEDHNEFFLRTNPEQGDILITKDGTLGVVRQVKTSTVFSIFVSVALVKPVLKEMSNYLEIAFSSPTVQKQMVGVGSGLQHIHLTDLRKDMIPIPPLEEQTEIVRRVEQLFAYADQIEQRVKDAQARVNHLTQSILAKAFRSELTADWRAQNPDLISGDNSAEALLARIRAERESTASKPKTRKRKVNA